MDRPKPNYPDAIVFFDSPLFAGRQPVNMSPVVIAIGEHSDAVAPLCEFAREVMSPGRLPARLIMRRQVPNIHLLHRLPY
jgi:hypothetical protein